MGLIVARNMLAPSMEAIADKQKHLHAGILSFVAAVCAVSVTIVGYKGASASGLALLSVGLLAAVLFAVLATRPLIAVVIALVFLTSPIPLALSQQQSALVNMFLLGGASLGLVLRTPLRSLATDPMRSPIGIFAAYGVVSAAYGLWVGNEVSYVLGDCFQVIEFALVYYLVAQLLRNRAQLRLALRFWLVSMLVTVLVELLLFALGPSASHFLPSWDASSGSELVRTIDIDATILFAVLINLHAVTRSRRQRFWIWVALVPTTINIALSLSRGLWLCTLVAGVVSLLLHCREERKRLLKAFALATFFVVLLAAALQTGSDSDSSLLSVFEGRVAYGGVQVAEGLAGTETMATRRFLEMAIVGPQVLNSPWIGHGLGATYVIGGFAVLDAGTEAPIDHHFIHNLYVATAFRMGVIGFGLLLWILVRYFRQIRHVYMDLPLDSNKALIIGLVASLAGQLVLSNTQPTLIDHPTCALIACAMALSFRMATTTSQSKELMGLNNGV